MGPTKVLFGVYGGCGKRLFSGEFPIGVPASDCGVKSSGSALLIICVEARLNCSAGVISELLKGVDGSIFCTVWLVEGLGGGFGKLILVSSLYKMDLLPWVILKDVVDSNRASILPPSSESELEPCGSLKKLGRASLFLPESSGLL